MSFGFSRLSGFVLGCALFVGVANAQTVLVLNNSVSGGMNSPEAQAALALGFGVEVVDNAGWLAKTPTDFASYRAIVLGDPTCGVSTATIAAAVNTTGVWGPVIDGNVILIGTDNVFHLSQGGQGLVNSGIAFATAAEGKTGAYITLSCYYHDTAPGTPVPLLDAFSPGGFTVKGVGCFNDAHIVASHPAVDMLTDGQLSNWSCSVHEAFDNWPKIGPEAFLVLAIAENAGGEYLAPDGTVGTPYILARGEGLSVISDIDLTPLNATKVIGGVHTVTAAVTEDAVPVVGVNVDFEVIGGPHTGMTGSDTTDAAGEATFTYPGSVLGSDTIVASFVDSLGATQTSNQAFADWVGPFELIDNGCTGSGGVPVLTATGSLAPASALQIDIVGALPGASGFVLMGSESANLIRKGCSLLFIPASFLPVVTDGVGGFTAIAHWPAGVISGQVLFLQAYVIDAGAPTGFATTNTVEITTP